MKQYTIGEFAKIVSKSPKTLRNWEKKGLLVAHRTLTDRLYYTDLHLLKGGINPETLKEIQ